MTTGTPNRIEQRIDRWVDFLPRLLYPESQPFAIEATVDPVPVPFAELPRRTWRTLLEGAPWGRNWDSGWFRLHARVPEDWRGKTVAARLNFGGEACVFSPDGEPWQGLSCGSLFLHPFVRDRLPLFDACEGGETVRLLVEAVAHSINGVTLDPDPVPADPRPSPNVGNVVHARLCRFDREVFNLWIEIDLLRRLMKGLPSRDPWRARLGRGLSEALDRFDFACPNPTPCRAHLAPLLAVRASDAWPTTLAVGHAHLDTAYLWPIRETIRKCARTFSNQIQLIKTDPDYVFGASQAQHYQFVKQHYPGLFARIRNAVRENRWELQGGLWVEPDGNIPSGESLVRQALHGQRFFQDTFDQTIRHAWLPDVFGFSGALPQILKKAGMSALMTHKLCWNDTTAFPHHTFRWAGIDGTEILVHIPPENTYNSQLFPDRLRFAAENFEERDRLPEFLTLFGIGNGGGGPTERHIHQGRLQHDLAGCPRVRFGSAQSFFDRLHPRCAELPVWHGELYLETHRGTLTSQARVKQVNRLVERQLQRLEMLWSCLPEARYPTMALKTAWETLLLHQFHDILPGSAIRQVYTEHAQTFQKLCANLDTLENEAATLLGADPESAGALTFINPTAHPVRTLVHLPSVGHGAIAFDSATIIAVQPDPEGGSWIPLTLDPFDVRCATRIDTTPTDRVENGSVRAGDLWLENGLFRYDFNAGGELTGIRDRASGREWMRPGETGNRFSLYEDWPARYDAWNIDASYTDCLRDTAHLRSARVLADGPHRAALRLEFTIGQSVILQEVQLGANAARLDFITRIDWRETRRMLRVAFPVDIRAPEAAYEIQFGLIRRPTHANTPHDAARFEVCGHSFVDLSDAERGVALLNNAKYGHRVHDSTLDLNLLRAPLYPDETADRGHHAFTYALLPHAGPLDKSDVIAQAHVLNQPPRTWPGRAAFRFPFSVRNGILLDTVKQAESGSGWILRLYEPLGRRTETVIECPSHAREAWETDLLENPETPVTLDANRIGLVFQPFEIKTLWIQRDPE